MPSLFNTFYLYLNLIMKHIHTRTKHNKYLNLILLVQWLSILTMSLFCIYCNFIEIGLLHWVSATKESMSWSQKGLKTPFLWPTNDYFAARTQCDKLFLRKWPKMPKEEAWSKLKILHCIWKAPLRVTSDQAFVRLDQAVPKLQVIC